MPSLDSGGVESLTCRPCAGGVLSMDGESRSKVGTTCRSATEATSGMYLGETRLPSLPTFLSLPYSPAYSSASPSTPVIGANLQQQQQQHLQSHPILRPPHNRRVIETCWRWGDLDASQRPWNR